MVKYLSGNIIEGSSTAVAPPAQTGFKELARKTVGSGGSSSITTDVFTEKDNLMILYNAFEADPRMRVGNDTIDTGQNYNYTYSEQGGAQSNSGSIKDRWQVNAGAGSHSNEGQFGYIEGVNQTGGEKFFILQTVDNCVGTGNSSNVGSYERTMKWTNTTDRINIARLYVNSGTMAEGSEIIVLGCDNDETGTTGAGKSPTHTDTNFWQRLDSSSPITTAGDTLDTGTFTAKKYLMIQVYGITSGGNFDMNYLRFNDDVATNGTNYSVSKSDNGVAMDSNNGISGILYQTANSAQDHFTEAYCLNQANREKLLYTEGVRHGGDGDTADPNRKEMVGKWTNTSDSITRIRAYNGGAGDYGVGSYIRVWGSN